MCVWASGGGVSVYGMSVVCFMGLCGACGRQEGGGVRGHYSWSLTEGRTWVQM